MSADLLCGVVAFVVVAVVLGVFFYRALWGSDPDHPRDRR